MPWQRRSGLSLTGDSLDAAHRRLIDAGLQAFVLSTCLRVEIVVAGDPDKTAAAIASVYGDPSLAAIAQIRTDADAFSYLCRLAAGLESPVVGEREIFVQFRQAVVGSKNSARGDLDRALQRAVGAARSIRRLLPGTEGSLATLAALHSADFDRVAVLGSGAMARAAASALGSKVTMFARRPESVAGHSSRPWSEVPAALRAFPALIAAVPGPVDCSALVEARRILERRSDSVFVVDLGMPPALPEVAALPMVRYLGIDDLAASSNDRPSPRMLDTARIESAKAWAQLTTDERIGQVIAGLIDQADAAVTDEVQRFVHRISAAQDPEPALRQMAHTVARRILHGPISYLSSTGREEAIQVLEEAFGVER